MRRPRLQVAIVESLTSATLQEAGSAGKPPLPVAIPSEPALHKVDAVVPTSVLTSMVGCRDPPELSVVAMVAHLIARLNASCGVDCTLTLGAHSVSVAQDKHVSEQISGGATAR